VTDGRTPPAIPTVYTAMTSLITQYTWSGVISFAQEHTLQIRLNDFWRALPPFDVDPPAGVLTTSDYRAAAVMLRDALISIIPERSGDIKKAYSDATRSSVRHR
jgi:hypothetical protein